MTRFLLFILLSTTSSMMASAQRFWRGADISWSTEMAADGKLFYNASGEATEINTLMHECGMNAIRLRVWAEPTLGGWCGTQDVVEKAVAAKAAGMEVMIDFHYSDFFADPGRQAIPAAWKTTDIATLAGHVGAHTTAVLQALKDAGVTPRWVQLGNETRNGMLFSVYDEASHSWSTASGLATGSTDTKKGGGWDNYVKLSNAGYEAAKAVFPDIVCIAHLDTRSSDTDLSWWFEAFKGKGGKVDMIGLSHYPMSWNAAGETSATTTGKQRNTALMSLATKLHQAYSLPVMVVETGVYCEYTTGGKAVMEDLFDQCRKSEAVEGIFYWEPEQYNWWKPAIYSTIGWTNYNMCAFLNDGRPSPILDAFQPTPEEIEAEGIAPLTVSTADDSHSPRYSLNGQRAKAGQHGIIVSRNGKVLQ